MTADPFCQNPAPGIETVYYRELRQNKFLEIDAWFLRALHSDTGNDPATEIASGSLIHSAKESEGGWCICEIAQLLTCQPGSNLARRESGMHACLHVCTCPYKSENSITGNEAVNYRESGQKCAGKRDRNWTGIETEYYRDWRQKKPGSEKAPYRDLSWFLPDFET